VKKEGEVARRPSSAAVGD